MLPDLEAGLVGGGEVEEVEHLLVVDLHVAHLDLGLVLRAGHRLDPLEEVVTQPGDDAGLALREITGSVHLYCIVHLYCTVYSYTDSGYTLHKWFCTPFIFLYCTPLLYSRVTLRIAGSVPLYCTHLGAHHGVRLARASLTVGEDARVIALERVK